MQMTSQLAAIDVPTAKFVQRERRRFKARHMGDWDLLRKLAQSDFP